MNAELVIWTLIRSWNPSRSLASGWLQIWGKIGAAYISGRLDGICTELCDATATCSTSCCMHIHTGISIPFETSDKKPSDSTHLHQPTRCPHHHSHPRGCVLPHITVLTPGAVYYPKLRLNAEIPWPAQTEDYTDSFDYDVTPVSDTSG